MARKTKIGKQFEKAYFKYECPFCKSRQIKNNSNNKKRVTAIQSNIQKAITIVLNIPYSNIKAIKVKH